LTLGDLAAPLGLRSVPCAARRVEAAAEVASLAPFLPAEASWIEAARRPVLMDTSNARRELRWRPRHDAAETLRQTVAAVAGSGSPTR
jgi:UDP-glucose 4-epimerase